MHQYDVQAGQLGEGAYLLPGGLAGERAQVDRVAPQPRQGEGPARRQELKQQQQANWNVPVSAPCGRGGKGAA
ncbi:MAG: hypothetical protein FD189_2273 [Elusimicrobia bacterium]|nr:MAG: hypothetical protein FD154_2248 [Elusimicrobiota bacterium]KAF0153793.1 MAG: hypothetical protein FD189_2273 [Elusimicrobiota bacterium]